MLLSETFCTITNFEPDHPDPDPVGNLLGPDSKKIRKNFGIRPDPDPDPCAPMYLVERAFSAATALLDNRRNRLEVVSPGDLRLFLAKIEPDIRKLTKLHQAHPSD